MVGTPPATPGDLCRLWAHEAMRVFHDRLVNDEDRMWFLNYTKDMVSRHMGLKFEDVFRPAGLDKSAPVEVTALQEVLFGDFMVAGAENPKYDEIPDHEKLVAVVEESLAEYNAQVRLDADT
eukprot:7118229-Pyramimonas_sp.AAC.1